MKVAAAYQRTAAHICRSDGENGSGSQCGFSSENRIPLIERQRTHAETYGKPVDGVAGAYRVTFSGRDQQQMLSDRQYARVFYIIVEGYFLRVDSAAATDRVQGVAAFYGVDFHKNSFLCF